MVTHFIIRKDKPSKDGKHLIQLICYMNGKRFKVSTGQKCRLENWIQEKDGQIIERVSVNEPFSKEINQILDKYEQLAILADKEALIKGVADKKAYICERLKGRFNKEDDLYFIQCEDRIKIGVTNNMNKRFSTIQNSVGLPITLLKHMPSCGSLEKVLHAKFNHLRLHGEWFKADFELMHFIKTFKVTHPKR